MGCEITSVYNDEIVGKVGYSQPIIDDLLDRDYRSACTIDPSQIQSFKIRNIQGFTQSYAIGKLFFTLIEEIENIIYPAGRFLVVEEVKSKKRKFVTNKDLITALVVKQKLCLVGVYGGVLVLWDLQFLEIKLQIFLPEGSFNVLTVGLTSKNIFATDNSQPNSMAFCYDFRTGKLKCFGKILTIEASISSITVGQNTHITAGGDGIWFIQALKNPDELSIKRGMFVQYPKTSIICIEQAKNYVIGGGVDGYIYIWKVETLKCMKALKAHDDQITAIKVDNNNVIIACMNGRVKIYTYKITKVQKKPNILQIQEEQDKQKKQTQDDQLITFVLVDSYIKEGSIFAIAVSVSNPELYYCQTRQGLLFQKQLVSANLKPSKLTHIILNEDIKRHNGKAHCLIFQKTMYSAYSENKKTIFIDIHHILNERFELCEQRVAKASEQLNPDYLCALVNTNEIAYLTKSNKVVVTESYGKVGDGLSNADQSNLGLNQKEIVNLQNEKPISINFVYSSLVQYLVVTTKQSVYIFKKIGRLLYQQIKHQNYQKKLPELIEIDNSKFIFQDLAKKWRLEKENWSTISSEELKLKEKLHCGKIISTDTRWKDLGFSLGQGCAIFYN